MIALIARYILFIQFIFSSFTTFSISVKTYQVQRINESTYLVTSFPDMDPDTHKRYLDKDDENKVITPNGEKKYTEDLDTTQSTVTVGEKKIKPKQKNVSPEVIQKARENYFRKYFAKTKKMNNSGSLIPEKASSYMNLVEPNKETNVSSGGKFKQNLLTARKYATVLINEIQYQVDTKTKEKILEESRRKKRYMNRKRRHKAYAAGVRRHMARIRSKNLYFPESSWVD
ncbi:unnamed protein product [Chrysodeixis includens]|uniref:Uncharacterized protein n=1 Tax=Chrysodeixis includens TaxID=689277 RepID=A0A9N8KW36_CHRIL|nr:unnamed protein product [Chrysodeixis includens]